MAVPSQVKGGQPPADGRRQGLLLRHQRMCKVMSDERGDGSRVLTMPQHHSRVPSRRCSSLPHRPEPPDAMKAG
jgi:hypothetical protein